MTLPFPVTENHVGDIAVAIEYFYNKAKGIWSAKLQNWSKPVFTINELKGTTAGQACYKLNKLKVNFVLYKQNKLDYLWNTIGHEVAHLIAYQVFGAAALRRNHHGAEWKLVMRSLGLAPDRCHQYDTSEVKRKVTIQKFMYRCSCREHNVSTVKHNRMKSGTRRYICLHCRGPIVFQNLFKTITQ